MGFVKRGFYWGHDTRNERDNVGDCGYEALRLPDGREGDSVEMPPMVLT